MWLSSVFKDREAREKNRQRRGWSCYHQSARDYQLWTDQDRRVFATSCPNGPTASVSVYCQQETVNNIEIIFLCLLFQNRCLLFLPVYFESGRTSLCNVVLMSPMHYTHSLSLFLSSGFLGCNPFPALQSCSVSSLLAPLPANKSSSLDIQILLIEPWCYVRYAVIFATLCSCS